MSEINQSQPKSGRGGARANAGRKKGSLTAKTQEIVAKAAAEGITPLEYMLSLLRDEAQSPEIRFDAAKSAAPYIHPRLSSVEAKVQAQGVREWLLTEK